MIGRALLLLPPLFGGRVQAQEAPGGDERTSTTLVTATREGEDRLEVPFATSVIEAHEFERRFARTLPQALAGVPGVSVQETGPGQGSPYLRGFTGYQTLLLIDGIRLNNSVFRAGPNQYWATVDPYSVERLEVVRGPSSVLYGSDAIGGTVNALTKGPNTWGEGFRHGERLYYRFASADNSDVVRGEHSATWGKSTGFFLGADGKWFDDVSGGEDIGRQENTGYDEWAGDVKVEHFLDAKTRLVFAHQRLQQDDAPRTHRTVFAESFEGTTVGTDQRLDFDQDRALTYLQIHSEDQPGAIDGFHASVSWHDQEEVQERVDRNLVASQQGFDVETLGLFAYASSPSPLGRLTYGADYYRDGVDSFSSTDPIQGPVADDASYDLFGVYLQDEIELGSRTSVTLGGRFNRAVVVADSVNVAGTETSLVDDWNALVGSLRCLHRLAEDSLHLFWGVSQGFRAPNVSDLTRRDIARSGEVEVPSPGLDPEETINYDLGIKGQTASTASQVAVFYTHVNDLILRRPTGVANEVVKENVGDGHVWGVEAEAAWEFAADWELFGAGTFVEGEVDTPTSATTTGEETLDKLMPFTAQLGVRWEREDCWAEFLAQGAGDADKLSTADTLDTQRIPPGGTPGYVVVHLRGGLRLGRHVAFDLGLENILDEDYRVHGSGLNRPGRSLVAGLTFAR